LTKYLAKYLANDLAKVVDSSNFYKRLRFVLGDFVTMSATPLTQLFMSSPFLGLRSSSDRTSKAQAQANSESYPYGIAVDNVSVAYSNSRLALYNASCYVEPGTITGLVGPNGGGKSTLFKAIMGFVTPSQGRVHIDELAIAQAQQNQIMAYVPQADEVDWQFPISVYDVVMMGRYGYMNVFRVPSRRDRAIVMDALERVGMAEFRDRQIGELSGGQKKRAFLARALAQASPVILLDEPFTGVDVKTEQQIIQLLMQLRDDGHTILVSTHDLASISTFCDRVILLNKTILAAGTLAETFTEENIAMTFGGLPLGKRDASDHASDHASDVSSDVSSDVATMNRSVGSRESNNNNPSKAAPPANPREWINPFNTFSAHAAADASAFEA
jgi:manganese transport system ATP-binding protein